MIISMVAGIGHNRQLGKDNQLLWRLKEDLNKFKSLTMGQTMVMGRKTFESIGRVLPGRTSVILTRKKDFTAPTGVHVFHSKEELKNWAYDNKIKELFVIGGSEIYGEFLKETNNLYLSLVDYDGPADVYFPEYKNENWDLKTEEAHPAKNDQLAWSFQHLYHARC